MVEYSILRNYVKQLKKLDIDKDERRELIHNTSLQSSLEAKIAILQFKELGKDMIITGGGLVGTVGGIYLVNNASNDIIRYILSFITVLPAVTLATGVVLALNNVWDATKNCYNCYAHNKSELIE